MARNKTQFASGPRLQAGPECGNLRFAKQLGLKDWQTEEITAALQACEKHARDELAQLALVWLRAEKVALYRRA
jgi:hypothetical protein